jgi:hypothetical protein
MKQSKTVKKLAAKVVQVSEAMQDLLTTEFSSFESLSYTVEFDLFPSSLIFSCVFKDTTEFERIKKEEKTYQKNLHKLLFKKGIVLKTPTLNLRFITE